jgi:hypothetical protein
VGGCCARRLSAGQGLLGERGAAWARLCVRELVECGASGVGDEQELGPVDVVDARGDAGLGAECERVEEQLEWWRPGSARVQAGVKRRKKRR